MSREMDVLKHKVKCYKKKKHCDRKEEPLFNVSTQLRKVTLKICQYKLLDFKDKGENRAGQNGAELSKNFETITKV